MYSIVLFMSLILSFFKSKLDDEALFYEIFMSDVVAMA